MNRKHLLNIFLVVLLNLLGFGLILPLLPFYADEFGATPTQIGFLVAVYSAFQMIGSPILGQLSDRYGRRPILLISIFGTFASLMLLGFANALWVLFLARILDGLTGGNISVAQAYIADVTDEKNRARGLGLVGAAFGLGFVFGPALASVLSPYGLAVPAFFAAALSLINWFTVLIWLPESLTEEEKGKRSGKSTDLHLQNYLSAFKHPQAGPLLVTRLVVGLAFNTFQAIFALYAMIRFDFNPQQTGYLLAYVGVLIVLVQGGVISPLTKRFHENHLLLTSMVLTFVALLGWALTPNIPILLAVMVPMALGAGIFNTVINSALSKAVYPEEVGEILGLGSSLESLTRVISPSASGYLLGQFGAAVPGIIGALIIGSIIPYTWQRLIVNPAPPLPKRPLEIGD
jgi:DHA1 family tetracycline resistance protein-like MFS transporter